MKAGRWRRGLGAGLALLFVISACNRGLEEAAPGNKLPVVTKIQFSPPAPKPGEDIRAVVEATDPENDKLVIEYQWHVNREAVGGNDQDELDGAELTAEDEVYVQVRAREKRTGRLGEWAYSPKIVIGAPGPSGLGGVDVEPKPLVKTSPAQAVVDFGDVEVATTAIYYRWFVNEMAVMAEDAAGPTLDPKYFKRGDKVKVWVCTDGKFEAPDGKTSPEYTVNNSPPQFLSAPQYHREGDQGIIIFQASDPDGDPIQYFLSEGPEGAVMEDARTGQVRINMKAAPPGTHTITCVVKDDHGGAAEYTTQVTVEEKVVPKPPPPEEPTPAEQYQPSPPPAEQPQEEEAPPEPPPAQEEQPASRAPE